MACRRLPALGAALVVCACACGCGSSARPVVAGRGSATGRHASVVVLGKVQRGQALTVRVRSVPRQRVRASWATTCTGSVVSRDAQDFAGRTPLEAAVPRSDSASCLVSATARLTRSGRVTVTLVVHP